MKEVIKIKNNSLAGLTAVFFAFFSFFLSIIIALLAASNIVSQGGFTGSVFMVFLFNLGAGIAFGILLFLCFGIFGWFFGWLAGGVYNFVAKRFGGIKIEFKDN